MRGWGEERIRPVEFPHAYPDLPPVNGRLKARPEDFVVDEVMAYEPSGDGEHLMVRVRKTGLAMDNFLKFVADRLGIRTAEVGYAGLKDKVAVTTQWLSVPVRCEERLDALRSARVEVIEFARHGNKLRTGHLKGNRFELLLRGAPHSAAAVALEVLQRFEREGMPNIYGNQRFGRELESVRVGRDVVDGSMNISAMGRMKRKFVISALQSFLFNLYALIRNQAHGLRTVLEGDILKKRETGGMFTCSDREVDQRRLDDGELVITGPIFGRKMVRAMADSHVLEARTLARLQLNLNSFDQFHTLGAGTRRPLLVFPTDVGAEATDKGTLLRFFLPKGCYATTLVREILKKDV